MLTLDKFEEASKIVSEVTLETKLVYSDFLSEKCGNSVYLKPENMQLTGAYKVRGAYYNFDKLIGLWYTHCVAAPNLATERGCLHVRIHIFSCFRTGKYSWLLYLQMVRRGR